MKTTLGNLWQRVNAVASRHADLAAILLVTAGLAHRLLVAGKTFLNPEEAYQVLVAVSRHPADTLDHPLIYNHPPMGLLLSRLVQLLHNSELAMRIPYVLAGAALPLITYAWLKRLRGVTAAWIALFILLMAPNLFFLGWQARGYIVALMGMAAALYALDRAVVQRSGLWMAVSFLGLYVAFLSAYMTLWFWMAATVYGLLRLRSLAGRSSSSEFHRRQATANGLRACSIVWLVGQAGAVALLGWLQHLRSAIARTAGMATIGDVQPYITNQYLSPGENPLTFLSRNTVGAFGYVFAWNTVGAIAFAAFLAGVFFLWTGKAPGSSRDRALVALLVLPFVFSAPAALIRVHPYGGTRHSVHLALVIAAGVAIGIEPLFRRRMALMAVLMILAVPVWYFRGPNDLAAVPQGHVLLRPFLAAKDYLQRHVPPGAVVLTDHESRMVLSYYLDPETPWPRGIRGIDEKVGGYTFFAPRWSYTSFDEIREDLAALRVRYEIPPDRPVWGIDTGFICAALWILHGDPLLRSELTTVEEFGLGSVVFEMPPGFESRRPSAQ